MNKKLAIQLDDVKIENQGSSTDIGEKSDMGIEEQVQTKKAKKYSTKTEATINLFKGYIGSGILALPYAFDEVGYLLSTIIFLIVAYIIYYTMNLLFKIADKNLKPGLGYPDLAEQLLGSKGVNTVKAMLCLFQIGCCVSYVIFFLKFFEHAFNTYGNKKDDVYYLLMALTVILPLSAVNDISTFAKASMLSNAFVIGTLIIIFINNFHHMAVGENTEKNLEDLADFARMPMIVGVSIYAFEAIGIVFSIRNSLEDTSEFAGIFKKVNIFITCLYALFASCGVIAFGHNMNEIILFSMPNKVYVHLFQILYAIALILTYPLQLLPSFQIMENTESLKKFINRGTEKWKLRQFASRFCVTILICLSAFLIPRFAVFLNMIGAIAGTSLQFFFPIIMYNKVFATELTKLQVHGHRGIVIFGIIGGGCAFIFSVIELFSPTEGD